MVGPFAADLSLADYDDDAGQEDPGADVFRLAVDQGTSYTGTIKSYNHSTGFGFVKCDALHKSFARDVFLHREQAKEAGVTKSGINVIFNVELSQKGWPQARNVRVAATQAGHSHLAKPLPVRHANHAADYRPSLCASGDAIYPPVDSGSRHHLAPVLIQNPADPRMAPSQIPVAGPEQQMIYFMQPAPDPSRPQQVLLQAQPVVQQDLSAMSAGNLIITHPQSLPQGQVISQFPVANQLPANPSPGSQQVIASLPQPQPQFIQRAYNTVLSQPVYVVPSQPPAMQVIQQPSAQSSGSYPVQYVQFIQHTLS
ncbi:hypothetical protein DIPPA_08333 [Diplonema papillatum]|nr:hypothetical protein DIPPA_08333 [Diplonema papillatum]